MMLHPTTEALACIDQVRWFVACMYVCTYIQIFVHDPTTEALACVDQEHLCVCIYLPIDYEHMCVCMYIYTGICVWPKN